MAVKLEDVQLGDRVTLRHGDDVLLGPLPVTSDTARGDGRITLVEMPGGVGAYSLQYLTNQGWVIVTAERPLPAEPGWYLDADGNGWRVQEDGVWQTWDDEDGVTSWRADHPYVHRAGPFTRLVPANEIESAASIVKTVLIDLMGRDLGTDLAAELRPHVAELRQKYGVTQ